MGQIELGRPDADLNKVIVDHLKERFKDGTPKQVYADVVWTLLFSAAKAWDTVVADECVADGGLAEFVRQAEGAYRTHLSRFTGSPKA